MLTINLQDIAVCRTFLLQFKIGILLHFWARQHSEPLMLGRLMQAASHFNIKLFTRTGEIPTFNCCWNFKLTFQRLNDAGSCTQSQFIVIYTVCPIQNLPGIFYFRLQNKSRTNNFARCMHCPVMFCPVTTHSILYCLITDCDMSQAYFVLWSLNIVVFSKR